VIWLVLATVVALYLLTGLGFAQLTWPLISDQARDSGHYRRAVAALVLLWPKALRDIRRDRRKGRER
jgi:hypothetical protein